jgi:hypothetical protein
MAGLVPAVALQIAKPEMTRLLNNRVKEIIPFRIIRQYQIHLPLPRPMLHVVLALNCGFDRIVLLEVDEALYGIPLRETVDEPVPVFMDSRTRSPVTPT